MSTTSFRRQATPVALVLIFALAAAALVGAGLAIGSSSRSLPGTGAADGSAAAAGGTVAGDLDALLAADQSAAKPVNPNKSVARRADHDSARPRHDQERRPHVAVGLRDRRHDRDRLPRRRGSGPEARGQGEGRGSRRR